MESPGSRVCGRSRRAAVAGRRSRWAAEAPVGGVAGQRSRRAAESPGGGVAGRRRRRAAPAPSASVARTAPPEPLAEAELVALRAVVGMSGSPVAIGSTAGGAPEAPVMVGAMLQRPTIERTFQAPSTRILACGAYERMACLYMHRSASGISIFFCS